MTGLAIRVDAFEPEDLKSIDVQDAQAVPGYDWLALGRRHAASGTALTARAGDGRILLCGGASEVHAGYATLWSVLARDAGPHLLGLTRRTRWFLATLPYRRIDAVTAKGWAAGCGWLELIGFEREAEIGAALEDGSDAIVYRWKGARCR